MTRHSRQILISAGEESGDLQGSNLVRAMREKAPDLQFHGLGGKKMHRAGVNTFFNIDRLGGLGLTGVLGGFFHHWKIYRKLAREIATGKYSAAILIHYPMFNLALARVCRRYGIPVFFFISPQVWAWRKGRIKAIRRTVDKMYVILPFEEPLYREAGVDVEFVGHPFTELVRPTCPRDQAAEEFGLHPDRPAVGLLPGSRKGEIDRLLPVMVEAAGKLKQQIPECQFLLPIADTIDPAYLRRHLAGSPVEIQTVRGRAYDVMNCCDFLICASGSVTLEAGLLGCPMVIVYRFNPLTYWFGRWLVRIRHFGLINIVAGEEVVPELLQHQVTPERLAREALSVLRGPERAAAIRSRLSQVRATLGRPGVAQRLAGSILQYLDSHGAHEKVSL